MYRMVVGCKLNYKTVSCFKTLKAWKKGGGELRKGNTVSTWVRWWVVVFVLSHGEATLRAPPDPVSFINTSVIVGSLKSS